MNSGVIGAGLPFGTAFTICFDARHVPLYLRPARRPGYDGTVIVVPGGDGGGN
ncbi:MAG: hypothetical protein U0360_00720 [Dehalococcoidia bacterium]